MRGPGPKGREDWQAWQMHKELRTAMEQLSNKTAEQNVNVVTPHVVERSALLPENESDDD
jgi:hypothetical protein